MITNQDIALWSINHPWQSADQIEQDLYTFERSPMLPLKTTAHAVESGYCSEKAEVSTFQIEELVATKLRAIYQRSKGRDLYDLWLALTNLSIPPEAIVSAFPAYRPEGVTSEMMIENLKRKLSDKQFLHDMDPLIRQGAPAYDPLEAGRLVVEKLFSQLESK